MNWLKVSCCAVLLWQGSVAQACGVCVEDKVAATYDHAVVQRASARGQIVVFCEVDGPVDAARIRQVARGIRGLDSASLRVSEVPAALSFSLDVSKLSPQAAAQAIEKGLTRGVQVRLLRLIDTHGQLRAAK